jgi:hypothetical protein
MSAATDNRNWQSDGGALTRDQIANSLNGPIAANVVLYAGTIAGQLLTDTAIHPALYPFVGDGTMRAVGIVTVGADNTTPAGIANARPPRVVAAAGCFVDKNAGGGSAITTANLFQPAYGADNQTVSALASDGPIVGQIVGVDFKTGQPVVLVDPVTALQFGVREVLSIAIPLAGLVVGGGIAAALTPGFAGRILGVTYSTTLVGAGATMALSLKIGGVAVTGGGATVTVANQTQGAELAGAAVTAANRFTAAQQLTVVNAAGTVFTSGQLQVNLLIGP